MSKLEIRGVIVSADWDDGWMEDFIKKGVMTPESRIRTQLAEASVNEPLSLYINSPGGSVFSGNEIINSVSAWALKTGQPVEITVGSLAASMAANMLVAIPATVRAHSNAKIMFHGPWGAMVGGAQAMGDTADLLEKMGADMKKSLLARTTLSAERIEEGFAEGRELWLTAQEAKDVGLVSEIVDSVADVVEFPQAAAEALVAHGLKLAAMQQFVDKTEVKAEGEPEPVAEPVADGDPDPAPVVAPDPEPEPEPVDDPVPEPEPDPAPEPEPTSDPAPAADPEPEPVNYDESKVIALVEANTQLGTDLEIANAKIEKLAAESRSWQGKHDQKVAELESFKTQAEADKAQLIKDQAKAVEDLTAQHAVEISERDCKIDGMQSRLGKLTLNALTFSPDGVTSWQEALDACNGEYAKARKKYPSQYNDYMEQRKKK